MPVDPRSNTTAYPITHNRHRFRTVLVRRWRALSPVYLLILVILFVGCGSVSTQATVGATLATFTATPSGLTTPVASPTGPPPTAVPSPTLGATATSVPVQPTATATRPAPASPVATRAQAAPATPTATAVEVRIVNFAFEPATVTVPVGTTVVWRNTDGFHTVLSGDFMLDSPALDVGETYAFTFTQAGEFRYICGIHPEMLGVVKVVP